MYINLKKTIKIIICLLLTTFCAFALKPDDILGKYNTPEKDGTIEIYKRSNKYFGKILTGKNPRKDIENPDPKLRNMDVIGMEFMFDFVYNGKEIWENGTIYDPNSGTTYKCKIWLTETNNLKVRGYVGFSLLGRTEEFERIKK